MRILQVSSAQSLGGGETHFIELCSELRRRGHEVTVAGRASGPLHPDITLPFLNSADFWTAFQLRKILRSKKFDVVHAHVARDYTVVAAAAWGVPSVRVVFTRHLLHPVKRHFLYRRVDAWIAPTSQILRTLDPLRPKNPAVIPNWVDVQKFGFRPHETHRPSVIGLLGQISPHKGHDDAIEAIRQLGPAYRLLIAGRGEQSYIDALKRKAKGLPVEFPGFVSLPDFFSMTDILIVPSWEEPFGIVLLEAMASGIPLIATNRGGPLDIIRPGKDGLLVEPRKPEALAQAIRRLSEDESMRLSIIRSARERVELTYEIRNVVPRIEAWYLG